MIGKIKNKVLNVWQNRRYRQLWQDHKLCISAIILVIAAAIIL
mgnify:FL=1|jgi:hypothetical protein